MEEGEGEGEGEGSFAFREVGTGKGVGGEGLKPGDAFYLHTQIRPGSVSRARI